MSDSKEITLVGAGLAGSLLTIFLARRGYAVQVYERRPDMRKVEIPAGRSINMAVSVRGIHALQQVGLDQTILSQAIPMKGRMVHALDGSLRFVPYGQREDEVIYSISRGRLNMILMDAAEQFPNVRLHFNRRCVEYDLENETLTLQDEARGKRLEVPGRRVIGTDGSASAVRLALQKRGGRFNFSQQFLEHGYKELTIPPGNGGSFRLEKNALHIWPRGGFMLIALPNADGSFTCTLFFPFEGEFSFATLDTEQKVLDFFQTQFPDAVPLMPTLTHDFFANPTGALVTIKCQPWHYEDRLLLLGDAAHAIVPFFGQGMNCAFEDCTYLDWCLEKHGDNWTAAFAEYEALRKANTDAIADMALENFIEMRDHVADPKFNLRKEVEFALERQFPERFIPRYSMVSFHRIPYAEAQARGRVQEGILQELCREIDSVQELDLEEARRLVEQKLTPFSSHGDELPN